MSQQSRARSRKALSPPPTANSHVCFCLSEPACAAVKITWTGLAPRDCVSHTLGLEARGQGAGRSGVWSGLFLVCRWPSSGSPGGGGERGEAGGVGGGAPVSLPRSAEPPALRPRDLGEPPVCSEHLGCWGTPLTSVNVAPVRRRAGPSCGPGRWRLGSNFGLFPSNVAVVGWPRPEYLAVRLRRDRGSRGFSLSP